MDRESLLKKLDKLLQQYKIFLEINQKYLLCDYILLLEKWNKIYRLTGLSDAEEMLERHLIDSLSLLPYLFGDNVLDVGTGAGLPGIPLAICRPDIQFVLLDSRDKAINFLNYVIISLQLVNVELVVSRVEQYKPQHQFSTIMARAVAKSGEIVAKSCHLLSFDGKYLLQKGKADVLAKEEIPLNYKQEVVALNCGLKERSLVIIQQET